MSEPPLIRERLPGVARALIDGARAKELTERYRLERYASSMLYLGTLHLIDLLDRLKLRKYRNPRVLEVGSHDFESAPALHAYFGGTLTGIELVPQRELAESRLQLIGGAPHRYLAGDVLEHQERYDVIVWLHPFLDRERLLEWGLAERHLRPRELYSHVRSLLRPGGLLLIVNQEESESRAQRALLEELGGVFESHEIELYFRGSEKPAYVHLVLG